MAMCAACSALQDGGQEHAGLMRKGRRGLQAPARGSMGGAEYFVCRLCGAEWLRDNGMQPVPKKARLAAGVVAIVRTAKRVGWH